MEPHNTTTIYLTRHGQTHSNVNKIMDGHLNAALTEQGEAQASDLAQTLQGVHFDAAFSSDLIRAKRTAEIALLERQLAVKTTELLRERYWGEYEGKSEQQYQEETKEIRELLNSMSLEDQWKTDMGKGIETMDQVYARFITFIREIAVSYGGKTVLVVCHGGVMRTVLHHIGWADHINLPSKSIENSAYAIIKTDGIEFEVGVTKGIHKKENV